MELIQGKAAFVLKSTLPVLASLPVLPEVVYGPLGDHPSLALTMSPSPSSPSPEASYTSNPRNVSQTAAGPDGSTAGCVSEDPSGGSPVSEYGGQAAEGSPVSLDPSHGRVAGSPGLKSPVRGLMASGGQLSNQASVLSMRASLFGAAALSPAEREVLAAASKARKDMRAQALMEELLGLEGRPEEEAGAAVEAGRDVSPMRGTGQRSKLAADLMAQAFAGARRESVVGGKEAEGKGKASQPASGFKDAFGAFGVRVSKDGDVGHDEEADSAAVTPTGAHEEQQQEVVGDQEAEGATPESASPLARVKGGKAPGGKKAKHQFSVTPQQLNIFMGGHLRRAPAAADRERQRQQEGGLKMTAEGILVTPSGVQVIREVEEVVEEEEEGSVGADGKRQGAEDDEGDEFDAGDVDRRREAYANGGDFRRRSSLADGSVRRRSVSTTGADGIRRTRTVVVREVVQTLPFEQQYDFRQSVWLPYDRRHRMLDDYDLGTALRYGMAGELAPEEAYLLSTGELSHPDVHLSTPRNGSSFLEEFEQELKRTRTARIKSARQGAAGRSGRSISRMSRLMSATVSSAAASEARPGSGGDGELGGGGSGGSISGSPKRSVGGGRTSSRFGRSRYSLVADAAYLTEEEELRLENAEVAAFMEAAGPGGAPWLEDIPPGEDSSASAAAAAAAASIGEDPAVLRLLGLSHNSPSARPTSILRSATADAAGPKPSPTKSVGSLSPWAVSSSAAAVAPVVASVVSPLRNSPGSEPVSPSGLLRARSTSLAASAAANAPGSPSGASLSAMQALLASRPLSLDLIRRTASSAGGDGSSALLGSPVGTPGSRGGARGSFFGGGPWASSPAARLAASLQQEELQAMVSAEASAALSSMFAGTAAQAGRVVSAKRARPGSRARKRGNLRTGAQALVDPLLAGVQQQQQVGRLVLQAAGAEGHRGEVHPQELTARGLQSLSQWAAGGGEGLGGWEAAAAQPDHGMDGLGEDVLQLERDRVAVEEDVQEAAGPGAEPLQQEQNVEPEPSLQAAAFAVAAVDGDAGSSSDAAPPDTHAVGGPAPGHTISLSRVHAAAAAAGVAADHTPRAPWSARPEADDGGHSPEPSRPPSESGAPHSGGEADSPHSVRPEATLAALSKALDRQQGPGAGETEAQLALLQARVGDVG